MWQLQDQRFEEKTGSNLASMRCLLLCCGLSRKTASGTCLELKHVAPMTGTSDNPIGDERCIDMLMVASDGLQTYRNNGKKRDNEWSLKNEKYFQYNGLDAVADAGMITVPMVGAS